jgi:hypothetical protein
MEICKSKNTPVGAEILSTLLNLYAKQENVRITYHIEKK